MVQIEDLAEAALQGDSLLLRSLVQDFFQESPCLSKIEKPDSTSPQLLATAAALLELFADRMHQPAPMWTKQIGPSPEPVYLLKSAATMKRLRQLCETAAPESLRKRRLYAPPNYLEFV
jgi:hypothetical protein